MTKKTQQGLPINTSAARRFSGSVLFTKDQEQQIDDRWYSGDRSVLVMKAMLDAERDGVKQ